MSEYAKQINDMVWSYSRVSSFDQCKYEFYLNYIINDDDIYLSENNYYAEVGGFVHLILEKIFKNELTLDEAAQFYADHFDEYVIHTVQQSTMDKTYELCADYFAEVDFEWLNDYEILGVELEANSVINGYKFIGYIDLLLRDKRDGKIVIIDNKSSDYPFNKNGTVKARCKESLMKYKRQMYLYAHYVKQEYGEFPKEITWNHFKHGGQLATIPFSQDEYEQAIKWFEDTIHQIENEELYEADPSFSIVAISVILDIVVSTRIW